MPLIIALQVAIEADDIPSQSQFQQWADAAMSDIDETGNAQSLTIRVTDEAESAALNLRYRHKQGPTNVLSFPFEEPPGVETRIFGDLVICSPVVKQEALQQNKSVDAHWAHMTVHGVLHLCGYDHIEDQQAERMESLEKNILEKLGYPSPYEETPQ